MTRIQKQEILRNKKRLLVGNMGSERPINHFLAQKEVIETKGKERQRYNSFTEATINKPATNPFNPCYLSFYRHFGRSHLLFDISQDSYSLELVRKFPESWFLKVIHTVLGISLSSLVYYRHLETEKHWPSSTRFLRSIDNELVLRDPLSPCNRYETQGIQQIIQQ